MIDGGDTFLTTEQAQRAEALQLARGLLVAPDAIDLHNLADYIVTGDDPWAGVVAESPEARTRGGGVVEGVRS